MHGLSESKVAKVIIGIRDPSKKFRKTSKVKLDLPKGINKRILMGVPSNTAYDMPNRDEEEQAKEPINNAYLLAIHEHGTIDGRIPARPLIEPVVNQEQTYINKSILDYLKLVSEKKLESANQRLDMLAIYLEGALVDYFDNNNWVPNAPITIARKGSAKPLIDTGDLRRSIRAFADDKE